MLHSMDGCEFSEVFMTELEKTSGQVPPEQMQVMRKLMPVFNATPPKTITAKINNESGEIEVELGRKDFKCSDALKLAGFQMVFTDDADQKYRMYTIKMDSLETTHDNLSQVANECGFRLELV